MPLRGGGAGRLMANAILNFHFDFPGTSLSGKLGKMEEKRETSWCELEERLGAGEMKRNGGD